MSPARDSTIDPDEVDDYPWDWTSELDDGETLASAAVTIETENATVVSETTTTTLHVARLSGATGAAGTAVRARCRAVTSLGRTLDATHVLVIQNH